jgi:hypothetical protein
VILLLFYWIKKWAGLFIERKFAFISQLLLAVILIPTITYFNFYDIGVVLFSTMALYFLFKRQFFWYLAAFGIGTLNHEVILLLVFVYWTIYYDQEKKSRLAFFILAQLLLYAAVRSVLFLSIPVSRPFDYGIVWFNLAYFIDPSKLPWMSWLVWRRLLLENLLCFIFWYTIAALGIKSAPKQLKRSIILLPLLIGVLFFFGKFNEARLFNSFIPVLVGLILCSISSFLANNPHSDKERHNS